MSTTLPTNAYLQLHFEPKILEKIIQNLNSNKIHGHDNISIRMLKICGGIIRVPLEMIFKQVLLACVFPSA